MSYVMCQYQYFVCPIEYSETQGAMTMECEPSRLFRLEEYTLPETMSGILKLVCVVVKEDHITVVIRKYKKCKKDKV